MPTIGKRQVTLRCRLTIFSGKLAGSGDDENKKTPFGTHYLNAARSGAGLALREFDPSVPVSIATITFKNVQYGQ